MVRASAAADLYGFRNHCHMCTSDQESKTAQPGVTVLQEHVVFDARIVPVRGEDRSASLPRFPLHAISRLTQQLDAVCCAVRFPMLAFHNARETTCGHFSEFAGIIA